MGRSCMVLEHDHVRWWNMTRSCMVLEHTVVSARLIGQFGLILWGETYDGAHFFLVRAAEKIKIVLDQKIPPKNYRGAKC